MIKAAGSAADGSPFVVFGLSDENWKRLRAGKPIMVNLRKDMHPDLPALTVLIFGGETEESLVEDLRTVAPERRAARE